MKYFYYYTGHLSQVTTQEVKKTILNSNYQKNYQFEQKLKNYERDKQLNKMSNIFFRKIKNNTVINET